ncbi:RHS repeat-associated core domain-containing protein [Paractinoplanes tereljensis]
MAPGLAARVGWWPDLVSRGRRCSATKVGGRSDSTGLTHLGAREYDPELGRFISHDPVLDTGAPQ